MLNGPSLVAVADWSRPSYPLRDVAGELVFGAFSSLVLKDMAERGLVSARGSPKTIRFFQFNFDQDETDRLLRESGHREKGRAPLQFLAIMMGARATIRKEILSVPCAADRKIRRRVIYQHK